MAYKFFEDAYKGMPLPVLVCRDSQGFPLVYTNQSALLLLNPLMTTQQLTNSGLVLSLADMLRMRPASAYTQMADTLRAKGTLMDWQAELINADGEPRSVSITGNRVHLQEGDYIVLYLYVADSSVARTDTNDSSSILSAVFHMAFHTPDIDEAINKILAYTGNCALVSRAYIFEEISPEYTSNTYEWCAPGVEPAIQDLGMLKKSDYNYDTIINSGMYITNDVRELPDNDRVILEAQGIKSLAILPLIYINKALGYIGFDDCDHYRVWSSRETALLQSIADIITSLLTRRNADAKVKRSLDILRLISDNLDSIVYVNDVRNYELVFVNNTLARTLNKTPEDLLGQPCWKVLQKDQNGPCAFCPMQHMLNNDKEIVNREYKWEFQNTITGKWYLAHDSIFAWMDGVDVHIETATDISKQKEFSDQLLYYATTDTMTGVNNREAGTRIISDLASGVLRSGPTSLVFIDLDGLKNVNDTYGHDAGDDMILTTLALIKECVRQSDTLIRWGGDEFILLLQCGIDTARRLMRKIELHIAAYNEKSDVPYALAFSYGITLIEPGKGRSLDDIISEADQLMYENKLAKRI